MAASKGGRRGFDISNVLRGCLPEDNTEKDTNLLRTEDDEDKKGTKFRKTKNNEDGKDCHKPALKDSGHDSENNAPTDHPNHQKTDPDIKEESTALKRRYNEEDANTTSPKKPRQETDLENPECNLSAFRKVGKNSLNVENDAKESFQKWERSPGSEQKPIGLPPGLAPPTYLAQQGVNLFNPFLGLNMLQQAEVSSMLSTKPHVYNEQSLVDAFGRSVSAMSTPLTESFANVKGGATEVTGEEPGFAGLKNRFPFNQIVNPMVEKLIHKNTSPLLIHSPINAANLSQNWCAKCNTSFRMTSDLVYHMRSHHKREFDPVKKKREESYKLKCDICNETFKERHHLTRHMTSHL